MKDGGWRVGGDSSEKGVTLPESRVFMVAGFRRELCFEFQLLLLIVIGSDV